MKDYQTWNVAWGVRTEHLHQVEIRAMTRMGSLSGKLQIIHFPPLDGSNEPRCFKLLILNNCSLFLISGS